MVEVTVTEQGDVRVEFPFTRETLISFVGWDVPEEQWEVFKAKIDWPKFIERLLYGQESWDVANRELTELTCEYRVVGLRKPALRRVDTRSERHFSLESAQEALAEYQDSEVAWRKEYDWSIERIPLTVPGTVEGQ